MLSEYLHNLIISINNIKIRILEDKTNNFLYCLLIKEIKYENKLARSGGKGHEDNEKEKLNYLFCHNKIINIGGIVLKEGYSESDEIFFNNDEKCNKVYFYTNPRVLIVVYNKIQIEIKHDNANQKLIINSINYDNLYIECIMNITQIRNLIKFNKQYLNNVIKENNQKDKKEDNSNINNIIINKEKGYNLLEIKIKDFYININFNYCYFIFSNSEQDINKFWMFYQNFLDKYYTMYIEHKKNSDISKKLNILSLIQKHFCYFENEFYLLYINQPKISIKNTNKNIFSLVSSSVISRLIQPNKISEKINLIIIDNKSNKTDSNVDNEQTLDNLFIPYYKNAIQYGYYNHNIFIISNLEMGNNYINFEEIDFDINSFVIYNLFNFYTIIFNYGDELEKKNINEKNTENNNGFNFVIKGKRINLNLMINKKWIEYLKDKKLDINCFGPHFYSEKIYISFENIQFNMNKNPQKESFNLSYNKLYVLFIMKNIIYPLIYIINSKNNISNNPSDKQKDNKIIISKLNNNNFNIESNYKYIINFDKFFSFVNPILISYYIIQYLKIFFYTFYIFKDNKNKSKNKRNLNDIEENLNIEFISAQYEIENFFKIFIKFLKNAEINGEEINFILFCHLATNISKFDIKNLFEKNENIFKLILSPVIILKLKEIYIKNNKIKINNILLIAKTKIENFFREDLIYKEIIYNSDINSENCEFIIYKSITKTNILEGEIKIEEKKKNIKIDLNIEDIVFCPISNYFNDIVIYIDKNIIKYTKMNSYLFSCFPFINEKMDLINYEKIIKKKYIYNNNINQNNDIKYKIKLNCNKLFLDLYSTNRNKIFDDRNIFENIIEKNKMRLIIEFDEISLEYVHNQKLNISLKKNKFGIFERS